MLWAFLRQQDCMIKKNFDFLKELHPLDLKNAASSFINDVWQFLFFYIWILLFSYPIQLQLSWAVTEFGLIPYFLFLALRSNQEEIRNTKTAGAYESCLSWNKETK